jgi:ATP-binding cassette subfamily B protein
MKYPVFYQLDSIDCGAVCLKMIAKFYGKRYNLNTLRAKCYLSKEGSSLLNISKAAESIGFRTQGVKLSLNDLKKKAKLPVIALWQQKPLYCHLQKYIVSTF